MLDILRTYKADIFRSLAHPVRVAIVEFLQYGERDADRLREKVGVAPEEFARHLQDLCRMRVVRSRTDRGRTYCSLCDPAFAKVLEALREYFLNHLNESIELVRAGHDDRPPGPAGPGRVGAR